MLHNYTFKYARLTCGQHASQKASVNLDVDIEDDDPFAKPAPSGHYQNGFACKGEVTFECSSTVAKQFMKMIEVELVVTDAGDSTKLKVVLMELLDVSPGIPNAMWGRPCHTKHYTWSFLCVQKPSIDNLGLFPDEIKRKVMKAYVFTRFPGFWNNTNTSAVITASSRQHAIALLDAELAKKGIAPLQEGGYSLQELDPTKPSVVVMSDGSE